MAIRFHMKRNLPFVLRYLELFLVWCLWVCFGLLSGRQLAWKGMCPLAHYTELGKRLGVIPYEDLISLIKKRQMAYTINLPYKRDEIFYYVFMEHPKIRHGVRCFMLCFGLCPLWVFGADWVPVYLIMLVLFSWGLFNVMRGCLELL